MLKTFLTKALVLLLPYSVKTETRHSVRKLRKSFSINLALTVLHNRNSVDDYLGAYLAYLG